MRICRERLYTEEELGNLEQREYGLLRRVKATIGRARRNVAKKIEDKIDKNIEELLNAGDKARGLRTKEDPKGSYEQLLNQIEKDTLRKQPDIYFTNEKSKDLNCGPYSVSRNPKTEKKYFRDLKIPNYANHIIFTGKQPQINETLHDIGRIRRASGKEGIIAKLINKKLAGSWEKSPTNQIFKTGGAGWTLKDTDAINRGGIVNNIKDITKYASKWLEERGANKYTNKALKRLLKKGKMTEEVYNNEREKAKAFMDATTSSAKINILSSIKNTIDIPSRRGWFVLKNIWEK